MADRILRTKWLAALQTACICVAVEVALVLLLDVFLHSYLGAFAVSVMILGPVSWWLAPVVYNRLLLPRSPT